MTGPDEERKTRSIFGSKAEVELAKEVFRIRRGEASDADRTHVKETLMGGFTDLVGGGPSRPPLEGIPPSRSEQPLETGPDGALELNPILPPPGAALGIAPGVGNDDDDDAADGKKPNWTDFVPLVARIPVDGHYNRRERVLRYLMLPGDRKTTAPLISTLAFEDDLRVAGFTPEDETSLLRIQCRTAQAFYTNLACGADGLSRFAP